MWVLIRPYPMPIIPNRKVTKQHIHRADNDIGDTRLFPIFVLPHGLTAFPLCFGERDMSCCVSSVLIASVFYASKRIYEFFSKKPFSFPVNILHIFFEIGRKSGLYTSVDRGKVAHIDNSGRGKQDEIFYVPLVFSFLRLSNILGYCFYSHSAAS